MKEEQIIRIWRIMYLKLFHFGGEIDNDNLEYIQDKNYEYECVKLFGRIYWVNNIIKLTNPSQ